jgi:hypothetical protein
MAIVMNMSGYEIEREEEAVEEYGDDVMCAEWIPALQQVSDRHAAEVDKHVAFTPELANLDVDAFLQNIYRNQR